MFNKYSYIYSGLYFLITCDSDSPIFEEIGCSGRNSFKKSAYYFRLGKCPSCKSTNIEKKIITKIKFISWKCNNCPEERPTYLMFKLW